MADRFNRPLTLSWTLRMLQYFGILIYIANGIQDQSDFGLIVSAIERRKCLESHLIFVNSVLSLYTHIHIRKPAIGLEKCYTENYFAA